jgi:hypothetical protein
VMLTGGAEGGKCSVRRRDGAVARRSRGGQRRFAGVVARGAGSGKLLRQWRRRPPPRALLLLLLLSSLFLWCGDGGKEKGHGWLGFRAATSGFLWDEPRACSAGQDAEGGDSRRSCHGHAARIRRLRRGG